MALAGSGTFKELKVTIYNSNGKFYAYLGEFSPEADCGIGDTIFQAIADLCHKLDLIHIKLVMD